MPRRSPRRTARSPTLTRKRSGSSPARVDRPPGRSAVSGDASAGPQPPGPTGRGRAPATAGSWRRASGASVDRRHGPLADALQRLDRGAPPPAITGTSSGRPPGTVLVVEGDDVPVGQPPDLLAARQGDLARRQLHPWDRRRPRPACRRRRGGSVGAGAQLRADAEGVDGRARAQQGRHRVLVEVARGDDLHLAEPGLVEHGPDLDATGRPGRRSRAARRRWRCPRPPARGRPRRPAGRRSPCRRCR